jgi:hypothetical protein
MNEKTDICRLCDGEAKYEFTLRNMNQYDVRYYVCDSCGSMQTEKPYWLEEAYSNSIRYTDTSVGDRTLRMLRITYFLSKIMNLPTRASILDWGGGNGLMTRFLRDLGFDARNYDMYDTNTYAAGFDDSPGKTYEMITAFEVLEHMAEPKIEINSIFERNPNIVFMSTCFYKRQDINWSYLAPYAGRHIFFYSPKSLGEIGKSKGYDSVIYNNLIFYSKSPISNWKKKLIRFGMRNRGQWWISVWLALRPPHGLMSADWIYMRDKVGDTKPRS